jgi:hypothetical protein
MARSHVPLVDVHDYPYLKASIDKVLDVNSAPGPGTGFGRPILDVIPKFTEDSTARLIVMFSDGEPFVGVSRGLQGVERDYLEQATAAANAAGVRVITVGVGEKGGAKTPLFTAEGEFAGEYASLHNSDLTFYLEEDVLREVAERTGGRYFTEDNRRALLAYIEGSLAPATGASVADDSWEYRSISNWLVLAALPVWVFVARRYILN